MSRNTSVIGGAILGALVLGGLLVQCARPSLEPAGTVIATPRRVICDSDESSQAVAAALRTELVRNTRARLHQNGHTWFRVDDLTVGASCEGVYILVAVEHYKWWRRRFDFGELRYRIDASASAELRNDALRAD